MRRRPVVLVVLFGLASSAVPLACGSNSVPSPFGPQAGGAAGTAGETGAAGFSLEVDGGPDADPTLGGPCEDDGQCDDELACTRDGCDQELGRCRFQPEDASCDDGVYCDGTELCDVREGCREGEPVACGDNTTCTIDVCVEATQSCRHDPRDADGDGEATWNCDGADCDDSNPLVSSQATEVCGNGVDDDCNQLIDETGCEQPEHDVCVDALNVTESGYYDLDLTATRFDYPTPCTPAKMGVVYRDVVVAISVPEGPPQDVDVIATMDQGEVSLGTVAVCGDAAGVSCERAFRAPSGAGVSRIVLRDLQPGAHALYVSGTREAAVQLKVTFAAPAGPPPGDRCEQALPLPVDTVLALRLVGYASDAGSICSQVFRVDDDEVDEPQPVTGEAFAKFSLVEASDVTLVAEAQDNLGAPVISLLGADCGPELTCRYTQPSSLFARALPAGDYAVAVRGSGPSDVTLRLSTAPATQAPSGEGCAAPPELLLGAEQLVNLAQRTDAVHPACLPGAPDATFAFALPATRDVALFARFSEGDRGAVSIAAPSCGALSPGRCASGVSTGLLEVGYGVPAGDYRAIVESARGNPVGLSRFERAALPASDISLLGDDCDSVVTIPETGGRFVGNTAAAFPNFDAGCDVGGGTPGGAPDQLLKLTLTSARRVLFDLTPSVPSERHAALLSIRGGEFCPGAELPMACAAGYADYRSLLDLHLQAGTYFVQVDGFDGSSGAWKLDVFTALE